MVNKKSKAVKKEKPPGYYCRICGIRKPQDAFLGRGHKGRVCQDCAKVPIRERLDSRYEDEIFHFLRQAQVPERGLERLKYLSGSKNRRVCELASLVLEVATLKPFRKGRLKALAQERPDLLEKLQHHNLIQ
jgi:hypothetical protein